jgi:hypothetical protein
MRRVANSPALVILQLRLRYACLQCYTLESAFWHSWISTPLIPQSWGDDWRSEGHPQTPGKVVSPLCTLLGERLGTVDASTPGRSFSCTTIVIPAEAGIQSQGGQNEAKPTNTPRRLISTPLIPQSWGMIRDLRDTLRLPAKWLRPSVYPYGSAQRRVSKSCLQGHRQSPGSGEALAHSGASHFP